MAETGFPISAMTAELAKLPAMVKKTVLTRSILGTDIPLLEIGEGEQTVLYVGAHHGSESITAALLCDFLSELVRRAESRESVSGVSVTYLLSHRKLLVVPMLNPDGVEYAVNGVTEDNPLFDRVHAMNGEAGDDFSHWQANARGVDLNHNYDAGFVAHKSIEHRRGLLGGAPGGFSGEYPESEPESAALARLIRARRGQLCGVVTLHTQGEVIFCGNPEANPPKTEAVSRLIERATGYCREIPEGSAAYGGLTDWCLEKMKLAAYTLECGKGENPLPMSCRAKIYEKLRTALFSLPLWLT